MNKIPRIRFNKYNEEWKLQEFNDLFIERHQIGNISNDYPQLSFTIADGVINPEDRKTNNRDFLIIDKENKKYLITEYNDIIYNPANIVYGAIHRNKLKNGVVSPIYRIFITNQDPVFMEHIVRNPSFIKQVSRRTEGTVTKLKTLKPDAFLKMECYISPDREEQESIGYLIENINQIIKLQIEKIEKLIILKKSLSNLLFPSTEEHNPRVRFNGFTSDWIQNKLGTICNRYDNLRIPVAANQRVSGKTPYYGANGIQDYVKGFTHKGEYVLVAEDGASDLRNYPVQYVKGEFWANNHVHVIQAKNHLSENKFLKYAISNINMEPIIVGGSRSKLNASTMMNIELKTPDKVEEQKLLGDLLYNVDNLITLNKEKLKKCENIRISLLNSMFV